jgi:hydroxyacylglutathione hydrolase
VILESFAVGPFQCNCTILGDGKTREAIVVDPGGEADRILAALARHGLRATAILHTHAHLDHLGATQAVKDATGASVLLHPEDLFLYENVAMQARMLGLPLVEVPPLDAHLAHEQEIRFGDIPTVCLHTPGHTPGSVSFLIPDQGLVLSGDTLFLGSIGRTDLPGGSFETIIESIRARLLPLPDETRVIPGHGPATTIGQEKRTNPFL